MGDYLPPEPELQKTFQVSRTTVRKAVEMLAQQGFVYIRQGRGTQILDFKATQKLGFVTSFSETLREKGFTVTQADIRVDFVPRRRRIAVGPPRGARGAAREDRARHAGQRVADRPDDQLPAAGARAGNRKADRGHELPVRVPGVRVQPRDRRRPRISSPRGRPPPRRRPAAVPDGSPAPGRPAHHATAAAGRSKWPSC